MPYFLTYPGPAFYWYGTGYRKVLTRLSPLMIIYSRCHQKKAWQGWCLAGLMPGKPSFGETMTKILRPVLAWGSSSTTLNTMRVWGRSGETNLIRITCQIMITPYNTIHISKSLVHDQLIQYPCFYPSCINDSVLISVIFCPSLDQNSFTAPKSS